MQEIGFQPVIDEQSRLLILGSFPSVKSRETGFYYGNRQNRFWRTVCGFFGEEIPGDPAGKRAFVLKRGIALWDIVARCEIRGSSDPSIRNEAAADLPALFARPQKIRRILCNGSAAYELLARYYSAYLPIARKLPSTSPANPRFSERVWFEALSEALQTSPAEISAKGLTSVKEACTI